jgi:hypothetical protein
MLGNARLADLLRYDAAIPNSKFFDDAPTIIDSYWWAWAGSLPI